MSYTIQGNSFYTYNMHIISSMGALDFPKRLGEIDHDWQDSNGVEAFVDSADLHWDGRTIQLMAFYEGSDMTADLNTFRGLYEGVEAILVTTYGSHTVTLNGIKIQNVYVVNSKAILILYFWEPDVSVPSVPTAIGGSGTSLGGYDFYQDFGLVVESVSGINDVDYRKKNLTDDDQAIQYSDLRKNRIVNIHLNGKYASISNLVTAIENLHAVLRSADVKVLSYMGDSYNVYFADHSNISVIAARSVASVRLKLRIEE